MNLVMMKRRPAKTSEWKTNCMEPSILTVSPTVLKTFSTTPWTKSKVVAATKRAVVAFSPGPYQAAAVTTAAVLSATAATAAFDN